jgi:hypothetical protein
MIWVKILVGYAAGSLVAAWLWHRFHQHLCRRAP